MKHTTPFVLLCILSVISGCNEAEPMNYHIILQPGPPPSIITEKPEFPADIIGVPPCADLLCCEKQLGMVPKPCVAVVLEANGQCTLVTSDDGTPCGDGSWCGGTPTCSLGVCTVPETAVQCSAIDPPPCNEMRCNLDTNECTAVPAEDDTPCEDGNSCSKDDVCVDGTCTAGSSLNCDDNDPCTADECMGSEGCIHTDLSGQTCDDGNACTTGDTCQAGTCGGGGLLNCDTDNPCVQNICDPLIGCVATNFTGKPCDDGNDCTDNDLCAEGSCQPGDNTCECTTDSDCPESENLGKGPLFCIDSECVADPEKAVQCESTDNPCTVAICQPSTGDCVEKSIGTDTPCNDDDACTTNDSCLEGDCVGGKPILCKDDFACTTDGCDPSIGCLFKPSSGQACDDKNVCTTEDICEDGSCIGGPELNCDDNETCTADSCNSTTGCLHTPKPGICNQGDPCEVGTCFEGTCQEFLPVKCEPSSKCVTAICDPTAQGCVETPIDCDDNDVCTSDDCSPNTGCVHTKEVCDDNDPCTTDACENGGCNHLPLNCNDGNPCTYGVCNGGLCDHEPIDCSDEVDCTQDVCDGGDCVHDLDDSACDDDNACTSDACIETGCEHTPIEGSCNDGDEKTTEDVCMDGVCTGTPIVNNQTCRTIKDTDPSAADGTYTIDPDKEGGNPPIQVHCDMTTHGGGWVLFGDINHAANNFGGSVHLGTFNSGTIGNVGYSLDVDQFYGATGATFDLLIKYGGSKVYAVSHNGYVKPPNGSFLVPPTQMDAIGEHGLLGTGPAEGYYATYCAVMWGCKDNGNDFFNFSTNGEYPKNWNHVPCGYYWHDPANWKSCPAPSDNAKRMRYFFRE